MITVSLSLALCTVMFRRFMDSFTGRIPAAIQNGPTFNPVNIPILTIIGALYYLYNHLRKGTLVRIGQGRQRQAGRSTSRLTIHRRPKNNSWFLRNASACRKKCTDAMYRIAKQSYDSLHNLNPCVLLPNKSFHISFSKVAHQPATSDGVRNDQSKNYCNLIYSNNSFNKEANDDDDDDKSPEVQIVQTPLRTAEDGGRAAGRRVRRSLAERLRENNVEVDDETNGSARLSSTQRNRKRPKKMKRMTRSGRVYSLVD